MRYEKENPGGEPGFATWMVDDLAKSGLDVRNFTIEPLRSEEELKQRLGFSTITGKPGKVHRIVDIGGYWLPYPNIPGYYRLKLKRAITDSKGKKSNYLSPSKRLGKGNHAYVLPEVEKLMKNYSPDKPIYITEGEKKATKATVEGFPCIGLSGVWMSGDKENEFLPEFDQYIWTDRTIYILFDSDITQKHNVKHAEIRLAVKLINRGAKVFSVRLPNEPNGAKNGLDDFLMRYGLGKLRKLVKDARPTIELHIDGDMRTERLLGEIAGIKSETEKDKLVKLISEKRGITKRAITKDLKTYKPQEEDEEVEKKYTADFPNLVDLAENENGDVTFLVKEGNELLIRHSVMLDGTIFYPPPRKQLPFKLLPRAEKVLKYYTSDSDSKLYDDLIEYHKAISELPSNEFYDLLALWDFHTYLLEPVQYSPYMWLYAIPERGKSRTGKGCINVAYRGIHVESLRDAYIIRAANDLRASIFFDVMDLRKKAENAGSDDILLQRFEKGALVPRVLYPDKGAHQDTKYFGIFGATIIGTNEPIHPVLETRAVLIPMPESTKKFEEDVTPERGLPLKERLIAFRARHLGETLPDVKKPVKGRLGDIMKPLLQIVLLVKPKKEKIIRDLIAHIDEDRKIQKSDSLEAGLLSVIISLELGVRGGLLPIKLVTQVYNNTLDEKYKTSEKTIGWRLKALGFKKKKRGDGMYIEFNTALIERLSQRFGLKLEDEEGDEDEEEDLHNGKKRHKRHQRHSTNDISDFSGDVFQDEGETSQKHHSQNAYKQRVSDVSGDDDVFPRSVPLPPKVQIALSKHGRGLTKDGILKMMEGEVEPERLGQILKTLEERHIIISRKKKNRYRRYITLYKLSESGLKMLKTFLDIMPKPNAQEYLS